MDLRISLSSLIEVLFLIISFIDDSEGLQLYVNKISRIFILYFYHCKLPPGLLIARPVLFPGYYNFTFPAG